VTVGDGPLLSGKAGITGRGYVAGAVVDEQDGRGFGADPPGGRNEERVVRLARAEFP
jgi:hypothetical protein